MSNFELDGPADIIVYEDDEGNLYAIVSALNSDAVQIIDISDLTNPAAVATIRDDVRTLNLMAQQVLQYMRMTAMSMQ